ncbi:MAG: methylenetetrahydrofolate reductase [NAD(P)H] [Ruminococcus sp.]|nr:methylenetetrahydrofolate reductase [NAD(P)H] [Ruminococcus sp.]
MKIANLFKDNEKTVFSFEVFPPKKDSPIESVYSKMEELCALKPDFISVTYGAGGTVGHSRTCEIASKIKYDFGVESVAHLTCVNSTKADIDSNLADLKANGIENILALRGDYVEGAEPKHDFRYASDLCEYIERVDEYREFFDIGGGCYPEVHGEAENEIEDILNLKKKVDAGASHLISQLFFDNNVYYRFIERAKIARIDVPIEAGIMPITNKNQITRMVSMSGASLPAKFSKILQKYENKPEALRDAGIAYAIEQIIDLIANGVDGIHLYTMNNPYIAGKITEAVANLL